MHEEGDGKQEGLHDVGHVEEATSIHLSPLRVIEVELQVAIEADAKEEHGEEGKLVRAERLAGCRKKNKEPAKRILDDLSTCN